MRFEWLYDGAESEGEMFIFFCLHDHVILQGAMIIIGGRVDQF